MWFTVKVILWLLKTLRVCLDWVYFVETENWNWKHCSKIIFKCVNSIVRPIFNKKVAKKCNLWDREQYTYALFTVDKVNNCGLKKKKRGKRGEKRRRGFQLKANSHLISNFSLLCAKFLAKLGLVCICRCRVYLYVKTVNFNILKTLNSCLTAEFGLYILFCSWSFLSWLLY